MRSPRQTTYRKIVSTCHCLALLKLTLSLLLLFCHRVMTAHSTELIQRVCDAYDNYYPKINDDHLLAMTVNPVMATKGFDDVVKLLEDDGSGAALKSRAKALLEQYLLNVLRAEERAKAKAGEEAPQCNSTSPSRDSNIMTPQPKCTLSRSERLKQSKSAKVYAEKMRSTKEVDLEAQAAKEVEAFFSKTLTQSKNSRIGGTE